MLSSNQINHYQNKLLCEIDSWDLKKMLEEAKDIIVIDARSSEAYDYEHIPRAINLPHRNMTEETTRHLDRQALVIVYCDGIGCNASTKGALNMVFLGFKVKELIGGLD